MSGLTDSERSAITCSGHASTLGESRLLSRSRYLSQLREHKRRVEDEIRTISDEIAGEVGEGSKVNIGPYRVRVQAPRASLRINDADSVPLEFVSAQPDKKLILRHFQRTGEALPGIDVSMGRPIVYVGSHLD